MDESLKTILEATEGEHYEFKFAANRFSVDELLKYACAFANCGGGKIVFGVSDERPRQIVGTKAFEQPERVCAHLIDKLKLRIEVQTFNEDGKLVVMFSIPQRPIGVPIEIDGRYWTRRGDSLTIMSADELRSILAESGNDFSAAPCPKARREDLDTTAIEDFRQRWITKSRNQRLKTLTQEQLLKDSGAITSEGITYAALVLFGTNEALGRLLGQCEIIFEYRQNEASGPAAFRQEFRQGFFSIYDPIWEMVNRRNTLQHFQSGLFVFDVPTFDELTIREAVLNAVSHRNYQYGGSVFIRQYPQRIVIESPGGLPADITLDNILERQSPRNRRLADIFSKCGLVERSGQGMNLMYEMSVKQAKNLPDLSKTEKYHVQIELDGVVRDTQLLVMLEKIGKEILAELSTDDFLLINCIKGDKKVPEPLQNRIARLVEFGILEKIGRGKFILSKRYYTAIGKKGVYTRKKGLERAEIKALLVKHIRSCGAEGSPLRELCDVLPSRSESQIQVLLRELRKENQITLIGNTKAGRWFIAESTENLIRT